MLVDYLGYFADSKLLETTRQLDWNNGAAVGDFFAMLEAKELLRVWGPGTEAHAFNAVSDWLIDKCRLPQFGSQLGKELVLICDYIHFVLDPGDQKEVIVKIGDVDPEQDETFDAAIVEYFTDLGAEYADSYLASGLEEYYEIFRDLRADMEKHADKTLIVLIPY